MNVATLINRQITVALIIGVAFGASCAGGIGDRPCETVNDPEFDGVWRAFDQRNSIIVELNVSHFTTFRCDIPEGSIHAHGFNNLPDSEWRLLSFTGNVVEVGLARGLLQLWTEGPTLEDEPDPLAAIGDQEIRRDGSTGSIELQLNYLGRQEQYMLVKQF